MSCKLNLVWIGTFLYFIYIYKYIIRFLLTFSSQFLSSIELEERLIRKIKEEGRRKKEFMQLVGDLNQRTVFMLLAQG
jgi:hypothetical protein